MGINKTVQNMNKTQKALEIEKLIKTLDRNFYFYYTKPINIK